MKISVDFENGMQVTLKPENLQLVDNASRETVLTFKTDHSIVPILFFKPLLATEDEIKAREPAKKAENKSD
jgi:hypothetical protein